MMPIDAPQEPANVRRIECHWRLQPSLAASFPLKRADAGNSEVVLATSVAAILRNRWDAPARRDAEDLVCCELDGTGCDYRRVGDAFRAAVKDAGISGRGRLSLHSLRHGFASLLIANGLNVVFVSRQSGHAKPTTTLAVYAHLFDQAEHARTARAALEAGHKTLAETRDEHQKPDLGNTRWQPTDRPDRPRTRGGGPERPPQRHHAVRGAHSVLVKSTTGSMRSPER